MQLCLRERERERDRQTTEREEEKKEKTCLPTYLRLEETLVSVFCWFLCQMYEDCNQSVCLSYIVSNMEVQWHCSCATCRNCEAYFGTFEWQIYAFCSRGQSKKWIEWSTLIQVVNSNSTRLIKRVKPLNHNLLISFIRFVLNLQAVLKIVR